MRIFATREYQLSRLPFGARLFYTLFLSMVLLGLLSCLGFMFAKSGMTAGGVAARKDHPAVSRGVQGIDLAPGAKVNESPDLTRAADASAGRVRAK